VIAFEVPARGDPAPAPPNGTEKKKIKGTRNAE